MAQFIGRMTFLIITITGIFSLPLAQAQDTDFLDIEYAENTDDTLEEGLILEDDLEVIDNLGKYRKLTEPKYKRVDEFLRYKRPKDLKPVPFKAYLKKNSVILKINDESKAYRVKRQLFVVAEERYIGSRFSYIHDTKGKMKFKTLTSNLVDISEDLKLTPQLPSHEEFPPPTQLNTSNAFQRYENAFFYKLDSVALGYYNDLYQTEGLTGNATRFEYRIFPKWDFLLDFGLALSYEKGLSEDEFGNQLLWNSFYFGPAIQYTLTENDKRKWEIYATTQKSLEYSATAGITPYSFSSIVLEMELLWKRKTKWGIFIIGGAIRQQYMSLDPEIRNIPRLPDRSTVNSLGLTLGYQFDFTL